MYLLIAVIVLALIAIGGSWLYISNKEKIQFYIEGMDQGFHTWEISTLWQVSQVCDLEEATSLYWSLPSLTKCIAQIKTHAETGGAASVGKMKSLLTKLYDYRTKIEKDADKKRGLESTRSLSVGQKLRIIFPGKGVFSSEITNNGRDITVLLPTQQGQITVSGREWVNQTVNVYLWRSGDARYVFDTTVLSEGLFLGKPSLHLQHTVNLIRTQKRNAVRAKCHINAELYILKEDDKDYDRVETKPGYKCIIEDISSKGALIRIGGKGVPNVKLRLQFQLDSRLVIMFGVIRTVEFNEEIGQSRLHFECIHIDNDMKNLVLSYVYNIMPQNEKEIYDAMSYTEEDAKKDSPEDFDSARLSDRLSNEVTDGITVYSAESKDEDEEKTSSDDDYLGVPADGNLSVENKELSPETGDMDTVF